MDTFKKIMKIVGICVAVCAVICGIVALVKKLTAKKEVEGEDDMENYVSCSCTDADFIAEQAK